MLELRGLSKRYEGNVVLGDVSLDVARGKVVSIVGENGAGKSTLLNILSGLVTPDAGEMRLQGGLYRPNGYGAAARLGITRVFQEQALIPNIPVYENLLLGLEDQFDRIGQWVDKAAMIAAAERIVEKAGIDVDVRRRTGAYDFSKRQTIEIARACLATHLVLGIKTPLVLLDEPTSALDQQDEQAFFRLVERMRRIGSLIFVSHRLAEVLTLSDEIHVLKDGRLVASLDADKADEATLHGLMVGREQVVDYYHEYRQRQISSFHPVVLRLQDLARDGAFEKVSMEVRAGEVVGIGGLLDSGKSALGRVASGVDQPTSGTVALAGDTPGRPDIVAFVERGLGYIPAERLAEGLIAPFPVDWNISAASGGDRLATRLGFWRRRQEVQTALTYIGKLGIRSGTPRQACTRLSGGNQQKVVLARWLSRDPRVLVLDNPTRGVDAGAKEEIYAIIRGLTDRGAGILLITDELLELIGLSNRILIMQRGRVVAEVAAPVDAKPTERALVAQMLPRGAVRPAAPGLTGAGHPADQLEQAI